MIYKEKEGSLGMNDVVGDFKGNYKYSQANLIIQEAFAHSNLVYFAGSVLMKETGELINQQTQTHALKLITIIFAKI